MRTHRTVLVGRGRWCETGPGGSDVNYSNTSEVRLSGTGNVSSRVSLQRGHFKGLGRVGRDVSRDRSDAILRIDGQDEARPTRKIVPDNQPIAVCGEPSQESSIRCVQAGGQGSNCPRLRHSGSQAHGSCSSLVRPPTDGYGPSRRRGKIWSARATDSTAPRVSAGSASHPPR